MRSICLMRSILLPVRNVLLSTLETFRTSIYRETGIFLTWMPIQYLSTYIRVDPVRGNDLSMG